MPLRHNFNNTKIFNEYGSFSFLNNYDDEIMNV